MDSVQKRMSASNPRCPWRGSRVYAPEAGFQIGNRRAANYSYALFDQILQSVKFTIRAIPQVGWTKFKAMPQTTFKAQTLNET